MKQPEALELAELFDRGGTNNALHRAAAAELRRLHEVAEALKKANEQTEHFERLWYFRGDLIEELVEALVSFTKSDYIKQQHPKRYAKALAALTKVRGEQSNG